MLNERREWNQNTDYIEVFFYYRSNVSTSCPNSQLTDQSIKWEEGELSKE